MTNNYHILHEEHIDDVPAILEELAQQLEVWKSESRILITSDQIEFLRDLANKHLMGQQLNTNQRVMKTRIHMAVGSGMDDIARLISLGFIGISSKFDPLGPVPDKPFPMTSEELRLHQYRRPRMMEKIDPPFKVDTWRKEVPVSCLETIVECFVEMYGEEYAIPLARAIEKGLKTNIDRSEIMDNRWTDTEIEVSIKKHMY